MIYFDHIFTRDQGHRFLRRLSKLGFRLAKEKVHHPGGSYCQFIYFPTGLKTTPRFQYLEFISNKDPNKGYRAPGLAFGYQRKLEKLAQSLKKEGRYSIDFEHRNYDWQSNPRERRLGWNFLYFRNKGFRSIYPWVIEYEYPPGFKRKPVKLPSPWHENRIERIEGLKICLNENGRRFFSYLLKKPLSEKVDLKSGTRLYLSSGRTNRIDAVILKSSHLPRFLKQYSVDEEIKFQRRPAGLLRNPSGMWDLVIR